MRFPGSTLVVLLLLVGGACADDDAGESPRRTFNAYVTHWSWQEGLHYGIDAPDVRASWKEQGLRMHPFLRGDIGIRAAIDGGGAYDGGDYIGLDENVELRRAYFFANGLFEDLPLPISFKLEVGVVGQQFSLQNASLALHGIPYLGTLRIGEFDAPMSLEMLSSSRASPLMERGLAVDALAPGSSSGFQFSNWLEALRVTWALGFFSLGGSKDTGDASESPARVTARTTWCPWRSTGGLLHLGISASWGFSPSENIRFRARPESFLAPYMADTSEIDGEQEIVVGLESAWVRDRLSLQGEYLTATVVRNATRDPNFGGVSLIASWFLTDDMRNYNDGEATFAALVPRRPLSWAARQLGALEVAVRGSYLDLSDADVHGGRTGALTTGINWYWNRYVRLQVNAGWAHATGGPRPGSAAIVQARVDLQI